MSAPGSGRRGAGHSVGRSATTATDLAAGQAMRAAIEEACARNAHTFARALLDVLRDDEALAAEFADVLGSSPVFTIASLAASIGVSEKVIRGAIRRGDLEARRSGRRWLISADAARAWAASRDRPSAPTPTRRSTVPSDEEIKRALRL